MRLGVDTGGTFTDAVDDRGRVVKVLSTPDDPARAIGGAAARFGERRTLDVLAHGTTVATNALLERRGARVALVTTRGFADVVEIARQRRPSLYDPFLDRPEPLVSRGLRFEVRERRDARGAVIEAWDGVLPEIPPEVAAVAVSLLHADRNADTERAVADGLRARGHDVTASCEISPEFREYERTVTAVVNAYLRPACTPYLERLAGLAPDVLVMTSAGGLVEVTDAERVPAALLLSGPAGGVRAAAEIAAACGFPDAVTFDMGGTSTDVCLVRGGVPEPSAQRVVGGFPIRLPAIDIHTIGAGGGSIARVDPGGALAVGPQSAGAAPGPACYGRGGADPTVTDADLVLGRIDREATFSDLGRLDVDAARHALAGAGIDAAGVVAVVDAAMEQAVRAVTVERGVDPRGLALVAFGGAGPLHACAIADALGMGAVLVPPRAGVASAVGMLCSPRRQEVVRTIGPDEELGRALGAVADEARRRVGARATVETAVDCRYVGQSHELTVPTVDDFPAEHERRNGHARPGAPVEAVAVRARATSHAPLSVADLPTVDRASIRGPAVVAEADCTVWVADGWDARPGALGTWVFDAAMTLDPAALQVLISRLTGIAEEMGASLRRAAYSPNIKERADCSAALFAPDGTLLVQAEHIPVHLGSMPAAVRAAIDACGARLGPGDQVVLNDPFAGGTHLNDVTLVAPAFTDDGGLAGWAANRAHHADLGGMAPGSMPPTATEIYQEGLRVPPVLCTAEVQEMFVTASRTPEERRGDLDAQLGANRLGVTRLREIAGAPFAEIVDYGERRMRAALRAIPDGRYQFADQLDSTGGPGNARPARIELAVTVAGDEIHFDFTGTDAQRAGTVNAVEAVTVSAVAWAIRTVTDPTIPANGGALRPVTVVAPAGSIVAAVPPVAVGAGNVEVSQRVADVCLGALATAVPARVGAASQGTMNNVLVGSQTWVYYETIGGGQGGRPGPRPGMSGVHTAMTNTLDTPVEALERAYAMRVRRYGLRRDSGGAGAAAGGDGIVRELEMLEPVTVSLITERRVSHPWGLAGGAPGATGENWLVPAGDETRAERLPDKCTVRLAAGDVLRLLTPGGGGWGRPP